LSELKLTVSPEDTFTIKFWVFKEKDSEVIRISKDKPIEKGYKYLYFKFQNVGALELIRIRRECTEYRKDLQIWHMDQDKLAEQWIRKLLREWNLQELLGEKVVIETVEGKLIDRCWNVLIRELNHVIFDYLVKRLWDVLG